MTKSAIQMHGAIGFTDEHEIGRYFKRAMTLSARHGNEAAHRARYAALGRPGVGAMNVLPFGTPPACRGYVMVMFGPFPIAWPPDARWRKLAPPRFRGCLKADGHPPHIS